MFYKGYTSSNNFVINKIIFRAYNKYYLHYILKKGLRINLNSKNYCSPFIPASCLVNNSFTHRQIQQAKNRIASNIDSASVFAQETPAPEAPVTPVQELPPGNIPAAPGELPAETPEEVGYLSIGVFTASGALPVADAVVTIYTLDENNEEYALYHLVTDANGQVPKVEVPVYYDQFNPLESSKYFFSTYNLRAQAINYYTYNLLDLRVFPNTTTNIAVDLIPVPAGTTTNPDMTFVIPPSPIDISND